ncbi:MAG: hypothetical protein QFB87_01525 [Patescibacteria group bacterium]|nr:hypothetical protein [Patescibacteria group bacterium]
MELDLQCGQCWNRAALTSYAKTVTELETNYATQHPQLQVFGGRISCSQAVVNEFGLGTVCIPDFEPTQITYLDQQLDLPGEAITTSEIEDFKFFKPENSWFNQHLEN